VARARTLAQLCDSFGVPLQAAAVQFPSRHPAVASVLIGCRSPQEVEEDVRLASVELPPELWEQLG
jgi:D-threo-aldose 1-dehydrogenase